jgi:hypothetical protein
LTRILFAVVLLALCAGPITARSEEMRFSSTRGSSCQVSVSADVSETTCAGPDGYVSLVTQREEMLTVDFLQRERRTKARDDASASLRWRGAGALQRDRIEWLIRNGKPFAAIIRVVSFSTAENVQEQFLIAKVTPGGSCEIGRVQALDEGAHATARNLAASQADNIQCN